MHIIYINVLVYGLQLKRLIFKTSFIKHQKESQVSDMKAFGLKIRRLKIIIKEKNRYHQNQVCTLFKKKPPKKQKNVKNMQSVHKRDKKKAPTITGEKIFRSDSPSDPRNVLIKASLNYIQTNNKRCTNEKRKRRSVMQSTS